MNIAHLACAIAVFEKYRPQESEVVFEHEGVFVHTPEPMAQEDSHTLENYGWSFEDGAWVHP